MAVCEIWDVRGRLDHPIDYAENPEKTANPKYTEADLQAMVDVMEYATNKDKTEQRFFVTGINCDPTTARDEMMIAKVQWNDTSEIVCYHGFQNVIVDIHGAVQAIGLALLVLFFVVGVMRTCGNFAEVKRPEQALKLFIRFAIAKGAVTYGLELMMALFKIVQGMISTIMNAAGFGSAQQTVLPQEIVTAVEDCGFFESIPLWAVTLIGGLFITVLSFIMIMSVYGRFFKLYIYTAIAPVPLSTFAGEPSQSVGKSFIKSYAAVCLEGAVIVLACIIFSLFASSPPVVNPDAAAVTMVWSYIGELVFNMLVLVGAVKMADRVVREMMGL